MQLFKITFFSLFSKSHTFFKFDIFKLECFHCKSVSYLQIAKALHINSHYRASGDLSTCLQDVFLTQLSK